VQGPVRAAGHHCGCGGGARPCPTTPRSGRPRRAWQRRPPSGAGQGVTRQPAVARRRSPPHPARPAAAARAYRPGCRARLGGSSASAWRASARWAVRRSPMMVARCSIGWVGWPRRPAQRASSCSVASVRGCWRSRSGAPATSAFGVVDRAGPCPHRAVAGGQQHADGLPVATPAWLGQVLAAQRLAGCWSGVQVIGLGAVAARRAGGTVDLDHPLALLEQGGGEPSPVAAGACGARKS